MCRVLFPQGSPMKPDEAKGIWSLKMPPSARNEAESTTRATLSWRYHRHRAEHNHGARPDVLNNTAAIPSFSGLAVVYGSVSIQRGRAQCSRQRRLAHFLQPGWREGDPDAFHRGAIIAPSATNLKRACRVPKTLQFPENA